jgi:hypothetical protein
MFGKTGENTRVQSMIEQKYGFPVRTGCRRDFRSGSHLSRRLRSERHCNLQCVCDRSIPDLRIGFEVNMTEKS